MYHTVKFVNKTKKIYRKKNSQNEITIGHKYKIENNRFLKFMHKKAQVKKKHGSRWRWKKKVNEIKTNLISPLKKETIPCTNKTRRVKDKSLNSLT